MATLRDLHKRADQLRRVGMTRHRILVQLGHEFPDADRDFLVRAAQIPGAPQGITPEWAMHGQPLRPTQIRFQLKKGAPLATGTRRTTPQRKEASPVLPEVLVDDGGRTGLPPPRWTAVDDLLEIISSGDLTGGDDGEGSTETGEGEDVLSGYEYPTMDVEARDILEGDYIEGVGLVRIVDHLKQYVGIMLDSLDHVLYTPEQKVSVRIEDDGL